jgi:signal transduction histidine kinase
LTIIYEINDVDTRILILALVFEIIFISIIYRINFKIMMEKRKGVGGVGIALSGIALVIYTLFREEGLSVKASALLLIGVILCTLGLLCWVKRESLSSYSEKFHLKINSKLRAENEQLNEVRLYLEKIVHNDSKKLPVYQGVVESLVENTENPAMREKALRVLAQIKDTRKEYFERISKELREKKVLLTTGLEFLDAVFKHYQKICAVKDIDFDLIIRGTPSIIKQVELETLVVNLLENAIIACEHNSQVYKSIVVNLSDGGISVIDNGIAFEKETLEFLGKQRVTTHTDSGGSGLGFLTIFEIARTCKASIVITETGEYKSVALKFDGKDEYRVEAQGAEIFS